MGAPLLDERQTEAVAVDRNAVVTAGAGSGKTTVLAERYVRLVRDRGASVESILTLTFTRKASAEMYARIYGRLAAERENPTVAAQLAHFDRAQISTLDSFCAQIARNWSRHYGVPDTFTVGEEETADMARRCALDFCLRHADSPGLLAMIRVNRFENVLDHFFSRIAAEYAHVAEPHDFAASFARQIDHLTEVVSTDHAALKSAFDEILALPTGAAKAVVQARAAIEQLADYSTLLGNNDFAAVADALHGFKLSRNTGSAKSAEVLEYKEAATRAMDIAAQIVDVCRTLASREMLEEMFRLCAEFQDDLLGMKRASGVLSFQDVIHMAVRTLTENRALRRHFKRQFRHIMIDEFQDNNDMQKELLYLLSERLDREGEGVPAVSDLEQDKLFFVGDEKQSIYRFRGADVSVFKSLSDELAGSGGRHVELTKNYRSGEAIVSFVNTMFARVMAEATEPYEARFEGATSGVTAGDEGTVQLFYLPYDADAAPDSAHADEAEAFFLARYINEVVSSGAIEIRDGDEMRPVRYEDIALLMRSTSNQIRYERIFRRQGIPYTTQSVRTLFLEAPLVDMYAYLQILVYPEDRAAYAAVLRSPFVGMGDDDVMRVLLRRAPPFAVTAVAGPNGARSSHRTGSDPPGDQKSSDDPKLSAGGRERFIGAAAAFVRMRERADRVPIAELVFDLWYELGYRYTVLKHAAYHAYLDYFDYFQRLAADADERGFTLARFLDVVRPNLGKYERVSDLEIIQDERPGVQILTVHKAKGLEFPVVILANAGNAARQNREAQEPFYASKRFGPTLRLTKEGNYFYRLGKEEEQRRDEAELKRVLYVALTRARSHLVISGCHNRGNRNNSAVLLNMVLKAAGFSASDEVLDGVSPVGMSVHLIPRVTEETLYSVRAGMPNVDPLAVASAYADSDVLERFPARTEWTATDLEDAWWSMHRSDGAAIETLPGIDADEVITDEEAERQFGTLCHAVLERALDDRFRALHPDWAADFPIEHLPARVTHAFAEGERSRVLSDGVRFAQNFLASPAGAAALRDPERRTEAGFVGRIDVDGVRHIVRGTFDLVFRDGDGVHVVDFKTDRDRVAGRYATQLLVYRHVASALYGLEARATLYFLRDDGRTESGGTAIDGGYEDDAAETERSLANIVREIAAAESGR